MQCYVIQIIIQGDAWLHGNIPRADCKDTNKKEKNYIFMGGGGGKL